ncbi:MAG TPA: PIG-L family deacetylase [Thermoanaerobaculia bacterium]|nr:PIG-L family deacetylase [Thermoanaerobaculia bacterium]
MSPSPGKVIPTVIAVRLLSFVVALLLPPAAGTAARLEPARPGERVVIIAPHIDDEGLAAGGYASDAIAAGADVHIVYITAGDHSRTALAVNRLTGFATARWNRKGQRRMREAHRVTEGIGLDAENLTLLGYPDRGLRRMLRNPHLSVRSASTGKRAVPYLDALSPGAEYRLENVLADLREVLESIRPDIVIAPLAEDRHPDHRAAALLVHRALGDLGLTPIRLGYIIHTRSIHAHARADRPDGDWVSYALTPATVEKKREMLAGYRSQRRSPYLRFLFGRSRGPQEVFLRYDG